MLVLDIFSGIGGFSVGLEAAGMRTIAFCESDPYARRVLAQHWPNVPCYDDIRTLTADRLAADGIAAELVCGGFPCQDISLAGRGAGLSGARSSLWWEFHRIIAETTPPWVIIENVSALRSRGLDQVLGGLAALGYDAEWHCIPAAAVGAPHRRDRIWIIAYPCSEGRRQELHGSHGDEGAHGAEHLLEPCSHGSVGHVADASGAGLPLAQQEGRHTGLLSPSRLRAAAERCSWWATEPDVGRVANGVPGRVDRLRALGNAVVPQIPELIGRAIMRIESE